jgi:DnaJ-class molecular chaperone
MNTYLVGQSGSVMTDNGFPYSVMTANHNARAFFCTELEAQIFADAMNEHIKTDVARWEPCRFCNGEGYVYDNFGGVACHVCNGLGSITVLDTEHCASRPNTASRPTALAASDGDGEALPAQRLKPGR